MSKSERDIVEALATCDEPLSESGSGDLSCALCSAWRPYDPHAENCPWQMARNYIRDRNARTL